jgi:phosphatidylglycerophosphatase A
LLPKAPGTFGSALAIPIFVLFSPLSFGLQIVTWLGLLGVGIWAAEIAGQAFGVEDDGRIVIDEVVGQWLAYLPLVPLGFVVAPGNWSTPASLILLVTGFVAFRCFDIAKPGPVGRAERHYHGGVGVMMDDVIAGAFAAVVLGLVALGLSAGGVL